MRMPRTADALRYALERKFAPHIEETWSEAFIIELRLIGVHGSRIGDALTEVDSHCAESGSTAADAFGDPVEYARGLGLPVEDDDARAMFTAIGPTIVQVIGMLILVFSFADAVRGRPFELTIGHTVVAALLATELAALALAAELILRAIVSHPVLSWLTFVANLGLMVLLLVLLDTNLARIHASWGAGVGGAVLIAGLAWSLTRKRTSRWLDDPLVAPLRAESPPSADRDGAKRLAALLDAFLPWQIPLATALILAYMWWLA